MARQYFSATVNASLGQGAYLLASGRGGAPTLDSATLTAAIAAAQLKGTGDASVEIDAIDAAAVALAPAVAGEVLLSYDGAEITSFNQLKRAVERLLQDAFASGTLTP